jgi:hypothetical protein
MNNVKNPQRRKFIQNTAVLVTAPLLPNTAAAAATKLAATLTSPTLPIATTMGSEMLRASFAFFYEQHITGIATAMHHAVWSNYTQPPKDLLFHYHLIADSYKWDYESLRKKLLGANSRDVENFITQNANTPLYNNLFANQPPEIVISDLNKAIINGEKGVNEFIQGLEKRIVDDVNSQTNELERKLEQEEEIRQKPRPTFTDMAAARKAAGYPIPADYPQEQRSKIAIGSYVSGCENYGTVTSRDEMLRAEHKTRN